MSISPQKKFDFKKRLEKLANGSFDDNDINWLLINLRPFSKGIIYELACFIAHPEPRNQGMSFSFIERTCVKLNFLLSNYQQNYFEMLDVVFERILIPSIDDIDDKTLRTKFAFTKRQARQFLKEMYIKNYGFYNVKFVDLDTTNKALLLANELIGTLMVKAALDPKQVLSALVSSLNNIASMVGKQIDVKNIVRNFGNDILLCISSLLHCCVFIMPDGQKPKVRLRFISADDPGVETKVRLSPVVFLPSFEDEEQTVGYIDMMYLDYDVSKYLLEEQKEIIRGGLEIETMELFRDDGGQLKIRIFDYQYVET